MAAYTIREGSPARLGAHLDEDGVNFAVFSDHASRIEVCLFSEDGTKEIARLGLPDRSGPIWHGRIDGLKAGALYGLRAHGAYAPEQGHRFNPNKLLLDPYARDLSGVWQNHPALLGYKKTAAEEDLSFDTRDSAAFVPKAVITEPDLGLPPAARTRGHDPADLIYEAHVRGLTMRHPDVEESARGTYDALGSDPMIEHLLALGVTAIELMPVHTFVDDGFLVDRGFRNYWGYNSIGFFVPEPRYRGASGAVGFRAMVERLHAAGISVLLDVVYNHTAEGDQRGPTLSFRGLDNASYYRLIQGQPRYYVNDTGCGNSLDIAHPFVLRMVMDSLRFWVDVMGVDGFRFDLGTAMGREAYGFDPHAGFFDALRQDPVLAGVTMIAEPWDLGPGGYRLGGFPPEFREWNDAFRDTARRYWRGDDHAAQELGARLLGSADRFNTAGRSARSSVNFVAAHDGFTLADVTRYVERHNEANGEHNRDGHHANHSDNCGIEGPTADPQISARRGRRQRNLLATVFLAQGTPMLLAGDEIGNSQNGNNNAYCQDNDIGWVNWDAPDTELLRFVRRLSAFRAEHPVLSQRAFLHGARRQADDAPDVVWTGFDGEPLEWRDPGLSGLCLTVRGAAEKNGTSDDAVFIVISREETAVRVVLPKVERGLRWQRWIDTADIVGTDWNPITVGAVEIAGDSVVAFSLTKDAG